MKKVFVLVLFVSQILHAGWFAGKKHVHLLFLGNTGTGKSSLINIFYNHIEGKRYENDRDIVIPLLDRSKKYLVNVEQYKAYGVKLKDNGESQTNEVREYTVENGDYVAHLWDAPGFNDTNGQITDEEHIEKIVTAIAEHSIHVIAVVMKADELDRRGMELKVNVNRIRTMLPKTAAKNVIGVFNRAASLSGSAKKSLKRDFSKLFELSSTDVEPEVYLIDGIPFFDQLVPGDGDDFKEMQARWEKDGTVIEKILEHASVNTPVSGKEMHEIQQVVKDIEEKITTRGVQLEALDRQVLTLALLEKDLESNQRKRDENKGYEKEKTLTVEKQRVEISRFLGFMWETSRRTVTDLHTGVAKYTDEVQLQYYKDAMAQIDTLAQQKAAAETARDELRTKSIVLMEEIVALQKRREELAISTNLDPFIRHLEERIRSIKNDKTIDEETRNARISMWKARSELYQSIRNARDDLSKSDL